MSLPGVLRSVYPDVHVPEMSLAKFILDNAQSFGDKVALIEEATGRQRTYQEFVHEVHLVAGGLSRLGMSKGDVICFITPNCLEFPMLYHGSLLLGAINTACNPLSPQEELKETIQDANVTFIFTIPELVVKVTQAIPQGHQIKAILVTDPVGGCVTYTSLLEGPEIEIPEVAINARQDVVSISYSSGTSGKPKGVLVTHYALIAQMMQLGRPEVGVMSSEDVILGAIPMYHSYGYLIFLNLNFMLGATMVILGRFYLSKYLQVIQDHKVTTLHTVPAVIKLLLDRPEVASYDLSCLQMVVSGTAPLKQEQELALRQRLKHVSTKQLYGMTEVNITHVSRENDPPGSVGLMLPNLECKVIDVEDGHACGPGEQGEMVLRGPQQMSGFLHQDQQYNNMISPGGWITTGDIGTYTADGVFYIVDRRKELIKYKGYQVAPAELDALLLTHDAVADAAVIGVPDDLAGQLPRAYVVKKPDSEVTEQQLQEYVAEHVSPQKKLRGGIEFVDEIPTINGKVLRRQLYQRYMEQLQQPHNHN